jgi:NAD(P)-dependent dehydrogenase (short-subunit alcohol dehydrogenase family)
MNRIGDSLAGRRVLITQSNEFMGPALCEAFRFYGADVVADPRPPITNTAVTDIINNAGEIDILIANLIPPQHNNKISYGNIWGSNHADEIDPYWHDQFRFMVDPLPKLAGYVLPYMKKRKYGKIVVMGSAGALTGNFGAASYNAARGAQVAWTQRAGTELAPYNVQINIIAQAWIDNPIFYPDHIKKTENHQQDIARNPAQRLGLAEECTQLAIFLSSFESNFFFGQCFPIAGGYIN